MDGDKPRRVFISCTSELTTYPEGRSYVEAAEAAIVRHGCVPVRMEYFGAADKPPPDVCIRQLEGCDLYIGIVGFKRGSLARHDQTKAYVEFEFDAAADLNIPRLIFLLDEEMALPLRLIDADRRSQDHFRNRLKSSNVTVTTFRTASDLERLVYQALVELIDLSRVRSRSAADIRRSIETRMAPQRIESYVERRGLLQKALKLIRKPSTEALVVTTAFHGAGGFGKTVLASEICRQSEIGASFPDGILWVTLGESLADGYLADKINDLSLAISGERPSYSDPQIAGFYFGQLLGDSQRLIVIDDVWDESQTRPFLQGGSKCKRLITTRNLNTLQWNTEMLLVGPMEDAEASELLTKGLEGVQGEDYQDLLQITGRWPVLLRLVNAAVRRSVRNGATPKIALKRAYDRLKEEGPSALDVADSKERNLAVKATLEASIVLLSEQRRTQYLTLAIFPEDVLIPDSVLKLFWGQVWKLTGSQVEDLCDELADLSLLDRESGYVRGVRLHDVIRSYLRSTSPGRVKEMNRLLVIAAAGLLSEVKEEAHAWWSLPTSEEYLWSKITYHLSDAREYDELRSTLLDLRFLAIKCHLLGAAAVESDMSRLQEPEVQELRREFNRASHLLDQKMLSAAGMATTIRARIDGNYILEKVSQRYDNLNLPGLLPLWPLPDRPHPALQRTIAVHSSTVWATSLSRDGRWCTTASDDGTCAILDLENGTVARSLNPRAGTMGTCSINHATNILATCTDDGFIRFWSLENGSLREQIAAHVGRINCCAFSEDGTLVATVGNDRTVCCWDVRTGTLVWKSAAHGDWVQVCAFSRSGDNLVTAGHDRLIRVWRVADGALLRTLEGHGDWVRWCAFDPNGDKLMTASADGTSRIWDLRTGEELRILTGHQGAVYTCGYSYNGEWFFTAGDDSLILLWRWDQEDPVAVLEGHRGAVLSCRVGPDDSWMLSASADGFVRLWDIALAYKPRSAIRGTDVGGACCDASPTGEELVVGGYDRVLRVWNKKSTALQMVRFDASLTSCKFMAGRWKAVASTANDKTLTVTELIPEPRGRLSVALPVIPWRLEQLEASTFVIGGMDGRIQVVRFGDEFFSELEERHDGAVRALSINPAKTLLVSGGADGLVRAVRVRDGTIMWSIDHGSGWPEACSFSPDGTLVILVGHSGRVIIRDAKSGELVRQFEAHHDWIDDCDVSHDGRWLATVGHDCTLRVWRLETGSSMASVRVEGSLNACVWIAGTLDLLVVGIAGVYLFRYSEGSMQRNDILS